MSRRVLFTALILEAADRGRLSLAPSGVDLDGHLVDEQGGHEVIELIDAGYLTVEPDGRIVPDPAADLTDYSCERREVAR
jgi:hypothetical protein